ncbi:MAG: flippase-like domain-containing protein [Candidatus Binatus sp.]|uniref:flippase-like domain-containing protein n=1 Tax=Candidatus Binatus sp. TaxID=2811406 RepID=UPI00271E71C3|nr:flippase-like domain-containing protein [Candidatus Binatus sp.]MDO8432607.1 flippase-like domain-containing protein [Candidatus Binatus sp.]
MNSRRQRAAWTMLGVALLCILIYESGPRRIVTDLSSVGIGLVAIILLEFIVDGFNTLGWWFTFPSELRRGSYRRLFFVRLAGTALNQTIPAASIGGEPAKVYLLTPDFPVATAIASVLTSSMTFSLSKVVFIACSVVVTWPRFHLPHGFSVAVLSGFIVTLGGILVLLVFQLRGFTTATKLIIARIPMPERWRQGIHRLTPNVDQEIIDFYRSRPRDLLLAALSHQLAFGCGVIQVWLLLGWLGLPRELVTCLAIESFTMLLGFVTFVVPDSIGVQEGSRLIAFTALGMPAAAGVAVGIAFRLTSIVGAAAGLLAFSILKGRRPADLVSGRTNQAIAPPG